MSEEVQEKNPQLVFATDPEFVMPQIAAQLSRPIRPYPA